MQTLTAKDAKYSFGRLIDLARTAPVAVAKHGRPVVVVMAIEEYERLVSLAAKKAPAARGHRTSNKVSREAGG
jgi:prevent-host-death family protein